MTRTVKISLVLIAIAVTGYLLGLHTLITRAAINSFQTSCVTASATSTLAYMLAGNATTTLACNMGVEGARSAKVVFQVNASSTNAVYNFFVEESMDGIDWYPIPMNQVASTTVPFSLNVNGSLSYKFASTTIGGLAAGASENALGVTGTDNRDHGSFEIPVDMKRVRVYVTMPFPTGAATSSGAIWMQVIPKIDIN